MCGRKRHLTRYTMVLCLLRLGNSSKIAPTIGSQVPTGQTIVKVHVGDATNGGHGQHAEHQEEEEVEEWRDGELCYGLGVHLARL